MTIFEILLVGLGLSMDAVAVSMTNGMVYVRLPRAKIFAAPFIFGGFQGLMPVLGYLTGGLFAEAMERFAGIVILVILGLIGGKMLLSGIFRNRRQQGSATAAFLPFRVLLLQALATSIDAFAVGVGLSAVHADIFPAVFHIGLITAGLTLPAFLCGRRFGDLFGNGAEMVGGLILIAIGIKAVL